MTRRFWVNFFVVLGLIALSVLVWFVGPMIGFGESWPLEGIFTRIIVISVFWLIAIVVWLIKWLRRRKQARALEEEVAGPEDDTPILREKLQDAMATLKKSSKRGGTAYLYDLPWYIIIGPPGSGKTTALVNSGLKFPLADKAGGAQAIAGTGGTRHCDWWFTEDAVMIDTAGRYTTQDSDADADSTSWGGFLDMLADNRPRQPINGVLICISIEDLMTVSPGELDAHANAIRRRLDELQNRLKIGFPVYVMFTKMDLVAGFMDFYGDLTPDQRAIVWGTTFKPKNKTDNMVTSFPEEFDELMLALSEQTTDRLQMEPDAQARTRVFGFPSQVASLKDPINNFLTRIFETTRYQADAALRGVYFTSGTQEGTPIDRVLGVLGRNFGAQGGMAIPFSGQGRSFFLTDLLQKVVFAESGWVSTNMAHLRRAFAIKTVMYVCLAAATIGVGGLWGYSYMQNKELVEQVEEGIVDYREMAAVQLAEAKIGDGDLGAVLAPLDKLRNMPQGYASRDDDIPLTQTFGLSQHEDLRRANIASYRDALDRLFTPRLIWRLESRLSNDINNIEFVYEALKVYLMMGGQARMDEDLIRTWMAREWSKQYPGAGNAKGRERLMAHLDAVLERPSSTVPLSGPLIQEAQRTLARMPVADRAYRLMMTLAASKEYEPWIASERGGPDAEVVFETRDGAPLSEVEIHGFFTYEGFHLGVLEEMENIIERAREENWVMGEVGEQADITGQFK
ncbi:MAG: type VI secretion system membrane subunit TssM, partial [Pseudomonadota bacterium]